MSQFFWPDQLDLSNWFPVEEVDRKRDELAALVRQLASQQLLEGQTLPDLPAIRFSAPTTSQESPGMVDFVDQVKGGSKKKLLFQKL